MNEFTKGEFQCERPDDDFGEYLNDEDRPTYVAQIGVTECPETAFLKFDGDRRADAELIAAAFTSATKLDALGYDALAVMKELPVIVSAFEHTARFHAAPYSDTEALLARILPEASHDEG